MEIVYLDPAVLVCVKPAGVLSTDEAGGLPELVRRELGEEKADLRTVHRLDRAVSGLMVLARSAEAASALSREVREGAFEKQYLAVVHGQTPESGELRDLLRRDKARKMTFVADAPGKGVQEAVLRYETLRRGAGMSLVRICLHTGRTHQIRVQFASRGLPALRGAEILRRAGRLRPCALVPSYRLYPSRDGRAPALCDGPAGLPPLDGL